MTAKQSIAWLQAAWKDDKKRINLLLVSGLAGMLLLCMSEWLPAGQSTQNAAQSSQQSQTAAEYEQQLETRLAALIRAMDGAGETVVMVTLDCGEETTYAADTRTEKTSEDTRSSAATLSTSLAIERATPGYWIFSASSRPSTARARCTCPIDAAATGSSSKCAKRRCSVRTTCCPR